MILSQIAIDIQFSHPTAYLPFVSMCNVNYKTIADYWKTWTGVNEETDKKSGVSSVTREYINIYSETSSIIDCANAEKSFYFDFQDQVLYVHYEHNYDYFLSYYSYGVFFGYSDKSVVYIDDIEYLPHIMNSPGIRQYQDFQEYKKLTFSESTIEINNLDGANDSLIHEDIYGNVIKILVIDDDLIIDDNGTASDCLPISSYTIGDYEISQKSISIKMTDMRLLSSFSIPPDVFSIESYPNIDDGLIGQPIPVLYGTIRIAKAICVTGALESGNDSFRVCELLTILSSSNIQVLIDKTWTSVNPVSIDLSTGSFVLSRYNARGDQDGVRDCRVLNPTGITINYTNDIIRDINERYSNIAFNSSNYDVAEWASEEIHLSSGGIIFEEKIDSYDAIRMVQNGSLRGFRYEFNKYGKRTIRIDDHNRTPVMTINNCDILDIDNISVFNSPEYVYAEILVKYSKDYNGGDHITVLNDANKNNVIKKFKRNNRVEIESILNNKNDAITCASFLASKYSGVRPIFSAILVGKEYFDLRIYDIVNIEITKGYTDIDTNTVIGRKFYGIKKCQIIGVDLNLKKNSNKISAIIIDN